MSTGEWAGAPYVRIYSTLARDHRRVWRDDRLLAAYVRLLMAADMAWPGPAELPRWADADVVETLVGEEVIDVEDDLYRFHGLDRERRIRSRRGQVGGLVRAGMADRDSLGRFAGGSLDEPSTNGTSEPVEELGGTSDRGPAYPARPPDRPPARQSGRAVGTSHAPAPAREGPDRSKIRCRHYDEHRSAHYWWQGVGWRCRTCDQEDKANDSMTFTEKLERYRDDEPF